MDAFTKQMQTLLLANPHSASASNPSISQEIVETARKKVLGLFKADPEKFDVVFVANATAGIKLVLEAFSGYRQGFDYRYHRDCHTSLVGVRELAQDSDCFLSDKEVEEWLAKGAPGSSIDGDLAMPLLFAYPAQSNMNGRRTPLSWPSLLRSAAQRSDVYTLLDVAALVSTSPLDLSDYATAPDFLVLSFYKMFGFPDLGALIVRRQASHVFQHRKYFGGGTTEMITVAGNPWVARKEGIHSKLEDGTGATHSILALSCAIDAHLKMFGSFKDISDHTGWLAKCLYDGLVDMKHADGSPVFHIYKDVHSTYGDTRTQGATVTFNISKPDGTWAGSAKVGVTAAAYGIHIRTGGLCNPAGMAQALGHDSEVLQNAYMSGYRCNGEQDLMNGTPMGMVRVSFGAMSTLHDVDTFIHFAKNNFVEDGGHVNKTLSNEKDLYLSEASTTVSTFMKHNPKTSKKKGLLRWKSALCLRS